MERIEGGEGGTAGSVVAAPPRSAAERRRRAGRIVCVLGFLLALALLGAGQLSRLWIPLDLLNHFTAHLLVLTTACLIGMIMPRARVLSALVIVLIGVIGIGVWPHYASDGDPPPLTAGPDERIVRVMTFNSRLVNRDWRAVFEEIVRHDPDILALVEIGGSQAALLDELAETYPHRVDCLAEAYCPLAILSKFPITDTSFRTRWRGPAFITAQFGSELGNLTVVGVHATRPPFFATHLEQMTVLGHLLDDIGGERIVVGDFNATPYSRVLRELASRSGLERVSHLPSWPAALELPQIAIDHIFLSPGLRLAGPVRIGSSAGSDHYPLIAEVAVPTPGHE
jgi:endonuclease/exonuclease/phosphatase (EEP) superfamily protein YafD